MEGSTALNKRDTSSEWAVFGGNKEAITGADGSLFIGRVIERTSKADGLAFRLTEKLIKYADGYGKLDWKYEYVAVARRNPAKVGFSPDWQQGLLVAIRKVVEGAPVSATIKKLGEELSIPYKSLRPSVWTASKWAKGETTSFLPHRSMVRPIFELLCEMGKKDEALASLTGYCSVVPKPSASVLEVLSEYAPKEA